MGQEKCTQTGCKYFAILSNPLFFCPQSVFPRDLLKSFLIVWLLMLLALPDLFLGVFPNVDILQKEKLKVYIMRLVMAEFWILVLSLLVNTVMAY